MSKEFLDTKQGHIETCDECICECPLKMDCLKRELKAGTIITTFESDECNCFDDWEDKKKYWEEEFGIELWIDEYHIERCKLI